MPTVVILGDFGHVEGGGSKVAISEALLLARNGHRVLFLAAVGPVDPRLLAAKVEVTCLGQSGLLDFRRHPGVAVQAVWNGAAYRAMKRLLAGLDPGNTIVHVHGYTKALSTSPIAAARKQGFAIVCTLHDFFSACPNGAFFDYVRQTPCPRVALSFDCITAHCDKRHPSHKLFRVARSAAQRTVSDFPGAVEDYIVLSDKSAEVLRPYLPKTARFHRVSNVTDSVQKPPVRVQDNGIILFVGRLDQEKGVELLAEAAGSLQREVVFVGDGRLRESLEGRPGITVTGWLHPTDVVGWLDRARCLVFPSLWFETYGLVVDEAAARGVPAIVSDVTAAAERVIDGVTGWHFRSGDRTALLDRLRLVDDDSVVQAVAEACYQAFWRDRPLPDSHAGVLAEVYHTTLMERADRIAGG